MYYICVENNSITSIMPYKPNVPETITVTEITDEQHDAILTAKTHYFDIETLSVVSYPEEHLSSEQQKEDQRIANAEQRFILESTDWKVLRHIREKALGNPTSLSEEEYVALEQTRADAAAAIVQIQ